MHKSKNFDVGVVGSSLFCAFLAGLLAKNHNKKVALFLDEAVQHRISREIIVSFDWAMRPQTIGMLQKGVSESLPLLSKIGGGDSIAKTEALLICQAELASDALSHLYHFLHLDGSEIERLSETEFKNSRSAFRVSGIKLIRPGVLWPAILNWLRANGVAVFDTQDMKIRHQKEGRAKIKMPADVVEMTDLILADELAILSYGHTRAISQLFVPITKSGALSQPVAGFKEQLVLNPENNFCGRHKLDNTIEVLTDGNLDGLKTGINNNILSNALIPDNSIRLNARCVFSTLRTRDGAAVVGKMARTGVWGCAGLGLGGLFLAPAIARYLCNKSSASELSYFAARCGDGRRKSSLISDGFLQESTQE